MSQNPFQSPQALPQRSPGRFHFPVMRMLGWYALTTGTAFAMLLAMPPGFTGVPYMGGVVGVFLVTFLVVATRERSRWINAFMVTAFWATLAIFDFVTAPPDAELASFDLSIAAAIHLVFQLAVCAIVPYVSKKLHEEREEMRGKD